MYDLPEPWCELGYPLRQIEGLAGPGCADEIAERMLMRAHPRCPEHGDVYFRFDVAQFLERRQCWDAGTQH